VEPKRVQPSGDFVINGKRCGFDWAVRVVRRHNAERARVGEEPRYIRQAADDRILRYRIEIIGMETVVEVVRVGDE
jgi:hypothetical protein